MAPRFDRHGYDKHLDITEDEYLAQLADRASDAADLDFFVEIWANGDSYLEGEPFEDTYFPGIADYDRFNRPSWGEEE